MLEIIVKVLIEFKLSIENYYNIKNNNFDYIFFKYILYKIERKNDE